MIHTQTSNLSPKLIWQFIKDCIKLHYCGIPTWSILTVVLLLSILTGISFNSSNQIFMAGEFASKNVIAERTLKVEDAHATLLRRDQTMALQPLIFDLQKQDVQNFTALFLNLLKNISSHGLDIDSLTNIQKEFNTQHQVEIERDFLITLANNEVQRYIIDTLLPFIENILLEGVFPDKNSFNTNSTAIIIRDTEKGDETLLAANANLPTLSNIYLHVGQEIRNAPLTTSEKSKLLFFVEKFMPASLQLNKEATTQRASSVVAAVPAIYYYIQKGEVIVSTGELVTREQQLKMQALYKFTAGKFDLAKFLGVFFLTGFFTLGFFMSPTSATNSNSILYPRVQIFIAFLLLATSLSSMLVGWIMETSLEEYARQIWSYSFPLAGLTALSSLVFSARRFYSISILLALFVTIFLNGDLALFLFFFLTSLVNIFLIIRAQSRSDVVISTITLFVMQVFLGIGSALYSSVALNQLGYVLLAILINTILSLFLIFALSPLIEMAFGLTTRFRLMELMSFDQPLLQELMMHTPGTYHHSIIVSNLVEAGANAVKANALLAKVGALYHDIGKIHRPEYFVENQTNGINKHDTLAPAMSALIIISHVKQGVELAEQYKLGKEITDIIAQHHGNRCISYFHHKACSLCEKEEDFPSESAFSYPNPRPQTKEAALVLLADAIEASTRALSDPTPARIESHVKKIVQGIYAEGQLDESELTFRDLNLLSAAFIRVLTGLFHQRIAYPEKKTKDSEAEK